MDDLKKSYEAPSKPPEILQDVKKRDDKTRTFAPSGDEMKKLAKMAKGKLKKPDVSIEPDERIIAKMEKSDVSIEPAERIIAKMEKSHDLKNINKYKDINLNDVNDLIDEIEGNITEKDNIVDLGNGGEVYFY